MRWCTKSTILSLSYFQTWSHRLPTPGDSMTINWVLLCQTRNLVLIVCPRPRAEGRGSKAIVFVAPHSWPHRRHPSTSSRRQRWVRTARRDPCSCAWWGGGHPHALCLPGILWPPGFRSLPTPHPRLCPHPHGPAPLFLQNPITFQPCSPTSGLSAKQAAEASQLTAFRLSITEVWTTNKANFLSRGLFLTNFCVSAALL